ncbi:MAG: proline dehydrogenase family protein, partial [Gaiellaceae bacterium]
MAIGEAVNGALRKAILASSGNAHVRGFASKHGLRLGASRFVAGEDLDACVDVLRELNGRGLYANTTLLGEDVRDEAEARTVVEKYLAILARLHAEELRTNVALKLTHLGLDIDEELAYENVERLVDRAAELGNFIRIDMEYSALVDPTLRIYRRLREAGHDNVGTVLQSYLYRTQDDLESLLSLQPNLRLVKGAYLEPESVAYPKKEDVDDVYLRLVQRSLTGGGYTAIATHDERMIEHALAFAEREGVGRDRFELQMLYGVRPQLQLDLAARGYKVLVATPFGPEWFPFFTRRLAE